MKVNIHPSLGTEFLCWFFFQINSGSPLQPLREIMRITVACHCVIFMIVWHFQNTSSRCSGPGESLDTTRHDSLANDNSSVKPEAQCSRWLEASYCPPWHYCNNSGLCTCGIAPNERVKCGNNNSLFVLDSYCVTFDKIKVRSEVGECVYNHKSIGHDKVDHIYLSWPSNTSEVNSEFCGAKFSRSGTLCGSCLPNHYPLAYSFNLTCVTCNEVAYNWVSYVAMAFLPLTLFYIIVLFFQISVLHSHLDGFVMFSQAVSFPGMCRLLIIAYSHNKLIFNSINVIGPLYSMWNMDTLRLFNNKICLKSGTLFVNFLDLLLALYPLFLIFLTFVGVKLYDKKFRPLIILLTPVLKFFQYCKLTFEIRTSLIDTFSTFLLLSSMKILNASSDILVPAGVHFLNEDGHKSSARRLYSNSSMAYLGKEHMPYACVCLLIIITFVLLPGLFLTMYPYGHCQRFLSKLPLPFQLSMHIYVDTFYGSYKDGTGENDFMDYRCFASFFFVIRILLLFIYGFTLNMMFFVLGSMVLVILCVLLLIIQPYKDPSRRDSLFLYLLCLSGIYSGIVGTDLSGRKAWSDIRIFQLFIVLFSTTPIFCAFFLIFCWAVRLNCTQQAKKRLSAHN